MGSEFLFEDQIDVEETLTAAEVFHKLQEAWMNEKFAPELLPCHPEIVDCIREQIQEMEKNILRAKKGDFKVKIHQLEIDRIRFVLNSYLRIRLCKIEKFAEYLRETKQLEDPERVTSEENIFALQFLAFNEEHIKSNLMRNMPSNLQTLSSAQVARHPTLDSYVFVSVNDDTNGVLVEEETLDSREEVMDLEKGDQHLIRYRPIAGLVTSGSLSLM